MADGLISFAFDDKPQDYRAFPERPVLARAVFRARFAREPASLPPGQHSTKRLPTNCLPYRTRQELRWWKASARWRHGLMGLGHLAVDRYADDTRGFCKGYLSFHDDGACSIAGATIANRRIIAAELARLLGVDEPVPENIRRHSAVK